jgi:hypothetical protein
MGARAALAGVAVVLSLAGAATAQEPAPPADNADVPVPEESGLPVSYAQRPLTLPQYTLRADLLGGVYHVGLGGFGSLELGLLALGAGFGILDDLEIDVVVVPLLLGDDITAGDNDVLYGNPAVGATYRFVAHEVVDVGASLAFSIPVDDNRFFGIQPGIPVRVRFAEIGRLDTGIYFSALIPVSDEVNDGDAIGAWAAGGLAPYPIFGDAGLPLRLSVNPIEYLFLGMNTGLGIANFEEADTYFFIPLGWQVGGTVPLDDRPLVDIAWTFQFPLLFLPAADIDDKVLEDLWYTGGSLNFYVPLGE